MIIVLEKDIPEKDKENLRSFLERNKFHVNEIRGEEETVFGAVGRLSIDPREVEILPGVARVIPISKPYKMASREFKRDDTIVEIPVTSAPGEPKQTVKIGGLRVSAIAGPCAVESREQMMAAARAVAAAGAVMLRGGAYKPRTSPYAFQGLGEEGVKILKEAGESVGLPVVTEIVSADHIPEMIDYVDVYQIGARNMQNFELLKKVGALNKPVILKRGISATIEEWLMAAEYLLSSGTDRVILCERGIRTYEKATRNTLDLSAIPILRGLTHLPIIVDPSHAVGIRDKVSPMGLAAIAAGADGIIVEVHCCPDKALSDGAQSLYPEQFEKLMRDIDVLAPVVGREVARLRRPRSPVSADGASCSCGSRREDAAQSDAVRKTAADTNVAAGTASRSEASAPRTRVCAFSGAPGAYAEQAIQHYFDGEIQTLAVDSFRDIFSAVMDGRADYGMVPIENSLAGSVYENYDNFSRFEDVTIAGSIKLRIEHCLLAVPGASLDTIQAVYSHPQGFPQCRNFLEAHPSWTRHDCISTASAAETVERLGSTANAAIASEVTAKLYHLDILKSGIEDDPRNYTRFVVITSADSHTADASASVPDSAPYTASVLFATKNEPGALHNVLGILQKHSINLTRLESRPIPGQPWRYMFYAGMILPEGVSDLGGVIEELRQGAQDVRVLGVYKESN